MGVGVGIWEMGKGGEGDRKGKHGGGCWCRGDGEGEHGGSVATA